MAQTLTIVDFLVYNNEDWSDPFVLGEEDARFDLTGGELRMDIRTSADSDQVVLSVSSEDGTIDITDALNGVFQFAVPMTTMVEVNPGTYKHDLLFISPGQAVKRLFGGKIKVADGVTL